MSCDFTSCPTEIQLHILSFLKPSDLISSSLVSNAWYKLSNDPCLWKNLLITGKLSSETIGRLLEKFTQLQNLVFDQMAIENWNWTTDLDMRGSLETLEIYFSSITAEKVADLVRIFPRLMKITLSRVCNAIDDDVIDELRNWKFLNEIRVDFSKVSDQRRCFVQIATECTKLAVLYVENASSIDDGSFLKLTELRGSNLKQLGLSCDIITDIGFRSLANCTNLTRLNLFNVKKMTDSGLVALKELANLQELLISRSKNLTRNGFVQLFSKQKFCYMTHLSLWNCKQVDKFVLEAVGICCPSLKHLQLCTCKNVSDQTIDVIAKHYKNLIELIVTGTKQISENGVKNILTNLKRLNYLDIENVPLTNNGVVDRILRRNPTLTAFCNGINVKLSRSVALRDIQTGKNRNIYQKIKKKYFIKKRVNFGVINTATVAINKIARKRKYTM